MSPFPLPVGEEVADRYRSCTHLEQASILNRLQGVNRLARIDHGAAQCFGLAAFGGMADKESRGQPGDEQISFFGKFRGLAAVLWIERGKHQKPVGGDRQLMLPR